MQGAFLINGVNETDENANDDDLGKKTIIVSREFGHTVGFWTPLLKASLSRGQV